MVTSSSRVLSSSGEQTNKSSDNSLHCLGGETLFLGRKDGREGGHLEEHNATMYIEAV